MFNDINDYGSSFGTSTSLNVNHVNESYDISAACGSMLIEAQQLNHAVINFFAESDFREVAVGRNLLDESAFVETLNEGVSDMLTKLKEGIKKVFAKIKEIIQAIITRITSHFITDGKKLVNKYGKIVTSKVNTGKVSKLKYKWKDIKDSGKKVAADQETVFKSLVDKLDKDAGKALDFFEKGKKSYTYKDYTSDAVKQAYDNTEISKFNDKDFKSYTADEQEEIVEQYCKEINSNASTLSELEKEIKEDWFDDEEEKEGVESARLTEITNILTTNKKNISEMEKAKRNVDKYIRDAQKPIEEIQKKVNKDSREQSPQALNSKIAGIMCSRGLYQLSAIQSVSGKAFATYTACIKDEFKQAKSLFLKILNHGKDDSKLDEATIDQIVESETYEMMYGTTFTESVFVDLF